ncbi:MAG TPA: mannose-6-phosphate isomerase, class I [Bacillaceae bacterium]
MVQPLFLSPVFMERIWGGTRLRDTFGYDIPSEQTGECWAISAHLNGPSIVKEGPYSGVALDRLWENHPELFGETSGRGTFPLLTTVQVHPGDEYAAKHENGNMGKSECWYIIDCKEGAEIILGHHANSREEFAAMAESGEWDLLLKRIPIKPGDFFYLPSGTIHAICGGTLVLETQQSSDTTYRVFDYDRVGEDGNKRELHLEKALDVTAIPHRDEKPEAMMEMKEGAKAITLVQSPYFSVHKWVIAGQAEFIMDRKFMLVSVLSGHAGMKVSGQKYDIRKGNHFILPSGSGRIGFDGKAEMIVSHV